MCAQINNPYLQKGIAKYRAVQKSDSNLRKGIFTYQQLLTNLNLAKKAIDEGQTEVKIKYLKEAENTIMKLKSFLDFDSGTEVVIIFNNLYDILIQSLREMTLPDKSTEQLKEIIKDVSALKEEFEKMDQREAEATSITNLKHLEC
jgi:flagellin-specific chaperone FliS